MSKKSILKDSLHSKKLALAGLSAAAAFGATAAANVVHAETYTVQAGDTLSEIAESHNTTVDNLAQTNNIANPDFIVAGQTIEVGGTVSSAMGVAQDLENDATAADTQAASADETAVQPQEVADASTTSEAPAQEEISVADSQAPQEAPVQEDTSAQDAATTSEAPAQEQADQTSTDQASEETSQASASEEDNQDTASSEEAQAPQDANAVISEDNASSEAPQEEATPASEAAEATSEAPAQEDEDSSAQAAPASSGYSSNLSAADAAAKEEIAQRESGGNYSAENGSYYGRYQLTRDYLNNDLSEENQERTADDYVNSRYGSWSAALDYWNANGWY